MSQNGINNEDDGQRPRISRLGVSSEPNLELWSEELSRMRDFTHWTGELLPWTSSHLEQT
jgi:hypothetical protein